MMYCLVVGPRFDLAVHHVVRLFERVVVRMCVRVRLVLDHEHRVQRGVEPLVDEHLQRDAAVDEQRGGHARGHLRGVLLETGAHRVDVDVVLAHFE